MNAATTHCQALYAWTHYYSAPLPSEFCTLYALYINLTITVSIEINAYVNLILLLAFCLLGSAVY